MVNLFIKKISFEIYLRVIAIKMFIYLQLHLKLTAQQRLQHRRSKELMLMPTIVAMANPILYQILLIKMCNRISKGEEIIIKK